MDRFNMSIKELMLEEKVMEIMERIAGEDKREMFADRIIDHNEIVQQKLKEVREQMDKTTDEEEYIELLDKELKLNKSMVWRDYIEKENANGEKKLLRERILFKDSITGLNKLNVKYIDNMYRLQKVNSNGTKEVMADIHLTEDKKLSGIRVKQVIEAITGKRINITEVRKMRRNPKLINGELYEIVIIKKPKNDYLKDAIKEFEVKRINDEQDKLEKLYLKSKSITYRKKAKRGEYTIFRANTTVTWELNELGQRIVSENKLGIEELSEDFSLIRMGDEWFDQSDFDLEYKMFSERTDRENEIVKEYDLDEIIDEILNEIDIY